MQLLMVQKSCSPVEVGSWFPSFTRFYTSQVVSRNSSINSINLISKKHGMRMHDTSVSADIFKDHKRQNRIAIQHKGWTCKWGMRINRNPADVANQQASCIITILLVARLQLGDQYISASFISTSLYIKKNVTISEICRFSWFCILLYHFCVNIISQTKGR